MKSINELSKKDIKDIELLVFDVDGVLVRRGTVIKSNRSYLELEVKVIDPFQIDQIWRLSQCGFKININSGRGLYMLQLMFREVLPYVSLTYENGSATWYEGNIVQHVNSYSRLTDALSELLFIEDERIDGWEPKEFIITIHCSERVPAIEKVMSKFENLYCLWNSEAYDIGIKNDQTKAIGLKSLMNFLKLEKQNVLVIGDNYNDKSMMDIGGVRITADKDRVSGDFWVPLNGDRLPADILMDKILNLKCEV